MVATANNKTCPKELGVAINVTDQTFEVPSWVDRYLGDECAVVVSSTPTPTPYPCRVKIDSVVAASMSASLTSWLCNGYNPLSDCPPQDDESTAERLVVMDVACLSAVVGVVGFILG